VVPNFVIQDGDPTGTGSGGPGYTIRCEYNMLRYGPGMVGMALSGKDTGGSQWFITHSPQHHLDGRYTIFAHVVRGMDVVGNIVQGDAISKSPDPRLAALLPGVLAVEEALDHGAQPPTGFRGLHHDLFVGEG
jgi:cyclophilin family peptidyl-prolyl cis-trans isomerase